MSAIEQQLLEFLRVRHEEFRDHVPVPRRQVDFLHPIDVGQPIEHRRLATLLDPEPDDCRHVVTDRLGVDLRVIPGDHAVLLHPVDPIVDRRARHVDPSGDLAERGSRVFLEDAEDLPVGVVQLHT
jgi:hypothetical protein